MVCCLVERMEQLDLVEGEGEREKMGKGGEGGRVGEKEGRDQGWVSCQVREGEGRQLETVSETIPQPEQRYKGHVWNHVTSRERSCDCHVTGRRD